MSDATNTMSLPATLDGLSVAQLQELMASISTQMQARATAERLEAEAGAMKTLAAAIPDWRKLVTDKLLPSVKAGNVPNAVLAVDEIDKVWNSIKIEFLGVVRPGKQKAARTGNGGGSGSGGGGKHGQKLLLAAMHQRPADAWTKADMREAVKALDVVGNQYFAGAANPTNISDGLLGGHWIGGNRGLLTTNLVTQSDRDGTQAFTLTGEGRQAAAAADTELRNLAAPATGSDNGDGDGNGKPAA